MNIPEIFDHFLNFVIAQFVPGTGNEEGASSGLCAASGTIVRGDFDEAALFRKAQKGQGR